LSYYRILALGLSCVFTAASAAPQLTKLPDLDELDLGRPPDLSQYHTYAWNKSQVPVDSLANHLRIINAIQDQMKKHGFRIDTVRPQVRIQYRLELSEKVEGRSTQQRSVWDDANATVQIDFSTEKLATFSIEFVDAESGFFLWQTKGTFRPETPDRAEKQIKEAVLDLFSHFPDEK